MIKGLVDQGLNVARVHQPVSPPQTVPGPRCLAAEFATAWLQPPCRGEGPVLLQHPPLAPLANDNPKGGLRPGIVGLSQQQCQQTEDPLLLQPPERLCPGFKDL